MITEAIALFGALTATFITPFATAADPIQLALPSQINYADYMLNQLRSASFSSDPHTPTRQISTGTVRAAGTANVQAFMSANKPCATANDQVTFTLVVRNFGTTAVTNAEATFIYKIERPGDDLAYTHAIPAPADDPTDGTIQWSLGTIPATTVRQISVTIETKKENDTFQPPLAVQLIVAHGGAGNTITGLTLPACEAKPTFLENDLPEKSPVIICDKAEPECAASKPTLGARFATATPEGAIFGPRFAEAIADIIPGECRILEDHIVITPAYHDAFTRYGGRFGRSPDISTAFYMQPLTESGRDFSRVVHGNDLLGIEHFTGTVRGTLLRTHQRNWHALRQLITDAIATNDPEKAHSAYSSTSNEWKQAIQNHHSDFFTAYQDVQETRKKKYEPVAKKAARNAITSITRSCGQDDPDNPYDGGLEQLLFGTPASPTDNGVQGIYFSALDGRVELYPATQVASLAEYAALLDGEIKSQLQSAKTVAQLRDFLAYIDRVEASAFSALMTPYETHQAVDKETDQATRLQRWETALDQPKTIATACERENKLGSHAEFTWCESGNYPEFIIRGAPDPANVNFLKPPRLIGDDPNSPEGLAEDTFINDATYYSACTGAPGDAFWASDCSCSCNQLVPDITDPLRPHLKFCQVVRDITTPGGSTGTTPPIDLIDDPRAIRVGLANDEFCPLSCGDGRVVPSCRNGEPLLNPCGQCQVAVCPDTTRAPTCTPSGQPIADPCNLLSAGPTSPPAPICTTKLCPNGTSQPTCDARGLPKADVCATHKAPAISTAPAETPTPPPTVIESCGFCARALCPGTCQCITKDRGICVAPEPPSAPAPGPATPRPPHLPIVRHDVYQQLPSAEERSDGSLIDECLFESEGPTSHIQPNPLDKFRVRF